MRVTFQIPQSRRRVCVLLDDEEGAKDRPVRPCGRSDSYGNGAVRRRPRPKFRIFILRTIASNRISERVGD